MNVFQRFRMALRLIPLLTGEKKANETIDAVSIQLPNFGERPVDPETSFTNMVKEGYRRNELIFSCIWKTANTSSQVTLKIQDSKGNDLDDHPLKKLLAQPNPYMTESDFWAAIVIYQKMAGVAYFEKERSGSGAVIRLWPLRPDWIKPIPDSETFISGYEYTVPGKPSETLLPENVLEFKLFDPLNQYTSWPPAAVAARAGDIDNSMTDMIRLLLQKGGVPLFVFKTKQSLNDDAIADIRRRWRERYGGFENWLEPAVLEQGAEIETIGMTFDELGIDVLDGREESRICSVIDIPPMIIGAKVGLDRSTYSNYSEARTAWWEDTLIAVYKNHLDTIRNGLIPEFGENIQAAWDFSGVFALQEERNSRWERGTTAFVAGAITRNEFYTEVGLPDRGLEGEVYLIPMSSFEVPSPTGKSYRPELEEAGDYPRIEALVSRGDNGGKAAGNAPDDAERRRSEREMFTTVRKYFRDQSQRIMATIGEAIDRG